MRRRKYRCFRTAKVTCLSHLPAKFYVWRPTDCGNIGKSSTKVPTISLLIIGRHTSCIYCVTSLQEYNILLNKGGHCNLAYNIYISCMLINQSLLYQSIYPSLLKRFLTFLRYMRWEHVVIKSLSSIVMIANLFYSESQAFMQLFKNSIHYKIQLEH